MQRALERQCLAAPLQLLRVLPQQFEGQVHEQVVVLHRLLEERQRLVGLAAAAQQGGREHEARVTVLRVGGDQAAKRGHDTLGGAVLATEGALELVGRGLELAGVEEHLAQGRVHEAVLLGRQRPCGAVAQLACVAVPPHVDEREEDLPPRVRMRRLARQHAVGALADEIRLRGRRQQRARQVVGRIQRAPRLEAPVGGELQRLRHVAAPRQVGLERRQRRIA